MGLAAAGRRACVLVDEAHAIADLQLLESFRMLTNFEAGGQLPLAVVLVGQPSLLPTLRHVSSFDQRLALTVSLSPLSADQSKHYILSRLKMAGCTRGIFTRSAGERISELARGIPRNINRLCELCLVVGFGFGVKKIKAEVVDAVAGDLGLLETSFVELPETTRLAHASASKSSATSLIADANRRQDLVTAPVASSSDDILAATAILGQVEPSPELTSDFPGTGGLSPAPTAEEDVLADLSTEEAPPPEDIMGSL
jgi:hypothetical protein